MPRLVSWGRSGCVLSSLAAACVLATLPNGPVTAQLQPPAALEYRHMVDFQLLGSVDGLGDPGGFRIGLQRRQRLNSSITLSGLYLRDDLSESIGAALGGSLSLQVLGAVFEPFAEVGVSAVNGRVEVFGLDTEGPGGEPGRLAFFEESSGTGLLWGAGLTVPIRIGGVGLARLGAGYWSAGGSDRVQPGGLRLSAALGAGLEDDPWYTLATDVTAPQILIPRLAGAEGDSVSAPDGTFEVIAADANGIDRVLAGASDLPLTGLADSPAGLEGAGPAVQASVQVDPPFGGQELTLTVRDRGGNVTRQNIQVFGAPDVEGPSITPIAGMRFGDADWAFAGLAGDYSGIADAWDGVCRVPVIVPIPDASSGETYEPGQRWIAGWTATPGNELQLTVRDRSGNSSRAVLVKRNPTPAQAGGVGVTVQARQMIGLGDGRRLVQLAGRAVDTSGDWVRSVTVGGVPVGMYSNGTPDAVSFRGWALVGAGENSVAVTAESQGGVGTTVELDLSGVTAAAVPEAPRVRAVIATRRGGALAGAVANSWAAAGFDRTSAMEAATAGELIEGLRSAAAEGGPGGFLWVHVEGSLLGVTSAVDPTIAINGTTVAWDYLERLLDSYRGDGILVSTDFQASRSWRALPYVVPGAGPAPGCLSLPGLEPRSLVGLPGVSASTVLRLMAGAADGNLDGVITLRELMEGGGVNDPGFASVPLDTPLIAVGGGR